MTDDLAAELITSVDALKVRVFPSERSMAMDAADHAAGVLQAAVAARGQARVILATGNSQRAFVAALAGRADIDWTKVVVFHMDEYLGVDRDNPGGLGHWLRTHVDDVLHPAELNYIDGTADPEAECRRYTALLTAAPIDLVCMGIGENGHIAFNEPFDTDFDDERWARIVQINERSVQQQVDEGHWANPDAVPKQAISLTVRALRAPENLMVIVPERRKASAVLTALTAAISPACPATVLRQEPKATLWLDDESSSAWFTATQQ